MAAREGTKVSKMFDVKFSLILEDKSRYVTSRPSSRSYGVSKP